MVRGMSEVVGEGDHRWKMWECMVREMQSCGFLWQDVIGQSCGREVVVQDVDTYRDVFK